MNRQGCVGLLFTEGLGQVFTGEPFPQGPGCGLRARGTRGAPQRLRRGGHGSGRPGPPQKGARWGRAGAAEGKEGKGRRRRGEGQGRAGSADKMAPAVRGLKSLVWQSECAARCRREGAAGAAVRGDCAATALGLRLCLLPRLGGIRVGAPLPAPGEGKGSQRLRGPAGGLPVPRSCRGSRARQRAAACAWQGSEVKLNTNNNNNKQLWRYFY